MKPEITKNDFEEIVEVSVSDTHKLAQLAPDDADKNAGIYRTCIARQLKQLFGSDIYTLREARVPGSLSYRIAVRTPRIAEFRQKIAELGLRIQPEEVTPGSSADSQAAE